MCVCGGAGGVGKTTTSAAVALGMAARGARVAVVTIDPARRLANALGLQELENEPRRVDPSRLRLRRRAVLRRAVGDDARPQAHVRRADRAGRRRPRPGGRDQAQPRLPAAVDGGLGLAGVHRRRQALRARGSRQLRSAGARHPAVAQRAGLPRGAGAADVVSGGSRAAHARAPDRPGDAGARPRRLAAAGRAAPRDRRRPAVGPVDVLRAARRHDRGVQRPRRPGGADAARPDDHVPAGDRRPRSGDRRGDLVPAHARRPAACRSAA